VTHLSSPPPHFPMSSWPRPGHHELLRAVVAAAAQTQPTEFEGTWGASSWSSYHPCAFILYQPLRPSCRVMPVPTELLQMSQKPSLYFFFQLAHSWQLDSGSSWKEIPGSTVHKSPNEGLKHLLAPGKMFAMGR